jgi:hypothetical protein
MMRGSLALHIMEIGARQSRREGNKRKNPIRGRLKKFLNLIVAVSASPQ